MVGITLIKYAFKTTVLATTANPCDNGKKDGMDDKMTKTIDLQVNAKNIADIKKGYPLILKDAIMNPERADKEGTIVRLIDRTVNSLRKAIMASKTKGLAGY